MTVRAVTVATIGNVPTRSCIQAWQARSGWLTQIIIVYVISVAHHVVAAHSMSVGRLRVQGQRSHDHDNEALLRLVCTRLQNCAGISRQLPTCIS